MTTRRNRHCYSVTVPETNDIAGELIVCQATAFTCRSLAEAWAWAEVKWQGHPPQGARIRHKDGTIYDIPSK